MTIDRPAPLAVAAPTLAAHRLNDELFLPKSSAAGADTRVCLGTITTTAVARPGPASGLVYIRAKTQADLHAPSPPPSHPLPPPNLLHHHHHLLLHRHHLLLRPRTCW